MLASITLLVSLSLRTIVAISIIVLFLSLRLVESAEVCFGKKVGRLWLLLHLAILHEAERLFATTIHLDDFHRTLCRDGLQVGSHVLVGRVGDETSQDVGLKLVEVAIGGLQDNVTCRNLLASLHIVVHLIVEAALQLGAHAGKLLRIERDVLVACGIGAHAHEVLHPSGATKLASARSGTTDATSLLSSTDLLHLDTNMEGIGEHLDELTEIDTFVGDVVEYRLVAIALVFHVTDLHLQTEVLGDLSALYHRAMLTALRLLALLDIHRLGDAVDALDVVG